MWAMPPPRWGVAGGGGLTGGRGVWLAAVARGVVGDRPARAALLPRRRAAAAPALAARGASDSDALKTHPSQRAGVEKRGQGGRARARRGVASRRHALHRAAAGPRGTAPNPRAPCRSLRAIAGAGWGLVGGLTGGRGAVEGGEGCGGGRGARPVLGRRQGQESGPAAAARSLCGSRQLAAAARRCRRLPPRPLAPAAPAPSPARVRGRRRAHVRRPIRRCDRRLGRHRQQPGERSTAGGAARACGPHGGRRGRRAWHRARRASAPNNLV